MFPTEEQLLNIIPDFMARLVKERFQNKEYIKGFCSWFHMIIILSQITSRKIFNAMASDDVWEFLPHDDYGSSRNFSLKICSSSLIMKDLFEKIKTIVPEWAKEISDLEQKERLRQLYYQNQIEKLKKEVVFSENRGEPIDEEAFKSQVNLYHLLGKLLVYRTCGVGVTYGRGLSNVTDANYFKWPIWRKVLPDGRIIYLWRFDSEVFAPDWNPYPICGFGLHGTVFGIGGKSYVDYYEHHPPNKKINRKVIYMIISPVGELIVLDGTEKIKFERGKIKFVGSKKAVIEYLLNHDAEEFLENAKADEEEIKRQIDSINKR